MSQAALLQASRWRTERQLQSDRLQFRLWAVRAPPSGGWRSARTEQARGPEPGTASRVTSDPAPHREPGPGAPGRPRQRRGGHAHRLPRAVVDDGSAAGDTAHALVAELQLQSAGPQAQDDPGAVPMASGEEQDALRIEGPEVELSHQSERGQKRVGYTRVVARDPSRWGSPGLGKSPGERAECRPHPNASSGSPGRRVRLCWTVGSPAGTRAQG